MISVIPRCMAQDNYLLQKNLTKKISFCDGTELSENCLMLISLEKIPPVFLKFTCACKEDLIKKKGPMATLKHKPVLAKVGNHGNNFRLLSTS